jgi:hypothetical protein
MPLFGMCAISGPPAVAGSSGMFLVPWVRNVAALRRPTAQNPCLGYACCENHPSLPEAEEFH